MFAFGVVRYTYKSCCKVSYVVLSSRYLSSARLNVRTSLSDRLAADAIEPVRTLNMVLQVESAEHW